MKKYAFIMAIIMGVAMPAFAADTAQEFVTKASIGDMFEIESSKLALQKSSSEDIKAFARQMVADHSKTFAEMKRTLENSRMSVLPAAALDEEHQTKLDDLKGLSGAEFDSEYIDAQQDAHDTAVDLYEEYSKHGGNATIRQLASKALPTLKKHQEHLEMMD